jgi:hypothetical protein
MTPTDRYFDETDAIAESILLFGLDVLVEDWRRAISGDGAGRARDRRSVRSMPPRPARR